MSDDERRRVLREKREAEARDDRRDTPDDEPEDHEEKGFF